MNEWGTRILRCLLAVFAVMSGAVLQGCTTNPATGESDFTPFMSRSDEKAIGAQQHPEILKQFGGALDDPEIAGYVAGVGGRLAANSELPDDQWTFTVLNSPVPNAFALPGGYVYVTRGLLSLVNSEAELAGVLGHEIGHVTARHAAKRYTNAAGVGLGAAILGAVTGSDVQKLAETGGALFLSSYSRGQEYQSDDLGIRYLAKTGYDPYAQADVLNGLGLVTAVEAKAAGRSTGGSDFFSTHPNTPDRVSRAREKAAETGIAPGDRQRYADRYLGTIDGMIYGDDPDQGVIVGNAFLHGPLGFAFTVADGFRLQNTTEAVIAQGPPGSAMIFSGAKVASGVSMVDYLRNDYAKTLTLSNLGSVTINGLPAATGTGQLNTSQGTVNVRLVVVRLEGDRVYRFQFLSTPDKTAAIDPVFRQIAATFHRLSSAEVRSIPDLRIRVVTVGRSDSIDSLAGRMATAGLKRERFMALNGLTGEADLRAGQQVKLVVAE